MRFIKLAFLEFAFVFFTLVWILISDWFKLNYVLFSDFPSRFLSIRFSFFRLLGSFINLVFPIFGFYKFHFSIL